ncbi:hypothetical protein HPB47_019516 [Ixodes persulcatus]|uniref:Uncharacterized protein n=1 Tax=Ixodes persulcatus TaxID=34615 RepID=A0AC60QHZ9_IXOPE|nr:hypothetical protein HPB47_019516 [Ixodes persulcatus]
MDSAPVVNAGMNKPGTDRKATKLKYFIMPLLPNEETKVVRDCLARQLDRKIGERGKDAVAAHLRAKCLPQTPTAQHGPYTGEPMKN